MAKALMGHMANDHLLLAQITSLRARVRRLETELEQLRGESVIKGASVTIGAPVTVSDVDFATEFVELGHPAHALA